MTSTIRWPSMTTAPGPIRAPSTSSRGAEMMATRILSMRRTRGGESGLVDCCRFWTRPIRLSSIATELVQTNVSHGGAASVLPVDPAMFDALSTEAARPELADLDLWTTIDSVRVFANDQLSVAAAVRDAAASIAVAVDAIADRMRAGGRLIYVGAGTGGRLAAVDAAEIGPSYGLYGR